MNSHKTSAPNLWVFIPMVILVAFTLRMPLTSLATAVPHLRADLGISTAQAGLLTSLPILMFASTSALASAAARKWGANRVLLVATVLLGLAVLIRPWGGYGLLVATTMAVGAFIAAGNVLLPVVIRRDFPHRQGDMLAVNTSSLTGGAAIAAATTGLFISWWGWRFALAAWAGIMVLAFLAILRFHRKYPETNQEALPDPTLAAQNLPKFFNPWKSPQVWALGIYFSLQSGLFYGSTAWLPSLLPDIANMTQDQANTGASVFQLLGIAGAFTAPLVIARLHSWRTYAALTSSCYLIMALGLLLAPGGAWVWLAIGGYGQGAIFAMLMALVTIRSATTAVVRTAGATMQTIGYIGAAAFPLLIGVFASSGEWDSSLVLLSVMSCFLLALAVVIGSPKRIGAASPAAS